MSELISSQHLKKNHLLKDAGELSQQGFVLKDESAAVLKNNLEPYLKKKGMSFADLSKATGVSRQMISMIVHDQIRPGVDVALKFEEVLGVPVQKLFTLTDEAWLTTATVGYDTPAYLWIPDLSIVDNKGRKERIKKAGGEYRHTGTGEVISKKEYGRRLQEFQREHKAERMVDVMDREDVSRNEALSIATNELDQEFSSEYEVLFRQIMVPIRR